MRIAILSDIHANAPALAAVLRQLRLDPAAGAGASAGAGARPGSGAGVDRIVCLGDVVGYNTGMAECVGMLGAAGVLCVAGNHDRAVAGLIPTEGFSDTAARAAAWSRRRADAGLVAWLAGLPLKAEVAGRLLLVHGALHVDEGCERLRLDTPARRAESFRALAAHPGGARLCAFGHTHRPALFEQPPGGGPERDRTAELLATANGAPAGAVDAAGVAGIGAGVSLHPGHLYLLNPGSVGEPRGEEVARVQRGQPARAPYLLLDLAAGRLSLCHALYDRRPVERATRAAGLGPRLGFLPPPLRRALRQGARAVGLLR